VSPKKRKPATRSPRSPLSLGHRKLTSHALQAEKYAKDVVDGKIVACKWVKLACKRHLDDREREKQPDFPYLFDGQKANKQCEFISLLPHTKGKWAAVGDRVKLQPWQQFNTCSIFGWVHKKTGYYRFTEAYIEVPRKNGKSIWAAGVGHVKLSADGEFGAEVYSGATSEKQAWEVFRPAKQMAERTPELREACGIAVNAKSLTIASNGSRFEPVIGKPGDGASPSCAIIDEYHEHQTDDLVDTMRTGMGARDNPLLLQITTAGSDRSSPCYAKHLEAKKVLEGTLQNDRLFAIVYTIDEGDDWKSDLALVKANPNYGISVAADFLKAEQQGAINSARKQNTFKTKHLNVWVNSAVAWINMAKWDELADKDLKIEDFYQAECFIGLDMASKLDFASKVRLFRKIVDGKKHYYAFAVHYLNEEAVEQTRGEHYAGWAAENRIVVTPGNETDYVWIHDDLVEDSKKMLVREIPYDPYHIAPLAQFIKARPDWNQSIPFVEIRQTTENMSSPMKELEGAVLGGRFHHDGDPVLGWMVSNVVCQPDRRDNLFPDKERPENKIDGAVALILAINRAMQGDLGSVYDQRGVLTL
jgi:phage terminase large subunit-like protein